MAPPPTAPAPSPAPPRREPEPADDIDIPLDPDPDPAPESTPAAAEALGEDLVAPPSTTTFVTNAAHESEVPTEQLPQVPPKPLHSSNTVAAAVGAVASAAVAAVKKRVTKQDDKKTTSPPPDDLTGEVISSYPSARPGPAGSIQGVGVTIQVTDLPRSLAFYRDTLGFHAIDQGSDSAVLASGDTRLILRTVHQLPPAPASFNLNLEVGDVDAVYEDLVAKGVAFAHPPQPVSRGDRLELWSATFKDPDAHSVAITQWRAIRA
jgi:catechol 2,3-dioxygenase-like lactoylglutathione lyase family enzyme